MTKVVGFVPCSPAFTENRLFDLNATRDAALERFVVTQRLLLEQGVDCQTSDMFSRTPIDVLFFYNISLEYDMVLNAVKNNPNIWLINIPIEPAMVAPLHHASILRHMPFDRILTWNDKLIPLGLPFVKANIGEPVIEPTSLPTIPFSKKRFMGCIYSNKSSHADNSLYDERVRAIEYFSMQPEGMDLYGIGWESSNVSAIRKSYLGKCDRKRDVLKEYKFSICFENTKGDVGLITEKIFDCFAAGTVPIYYGSPNIQDYIPEQCFIDFRAFNNYDELHAFLVDMSEDDYGAYLSAVIAFLHSDQYYPFTSKSFAETVLKQIHDLSGLTPPVRRGWRFKWNVLRASLYHVPRNVKNFFRYLRFLFKFVTAS